jgi:hypothetical protein
MSDPDTGIDSFDLPNDIRVLDPFTMFLRAESRVFGPDRLYTITYRVSDRCGNSTQVSATVRVPRLLFLLPPAKDEK